MAAPWGDAIRRLREQRKITRKQLAREAKLSVTTYGIIERGGHTQTRNLEKIAIALQVDLAEVLVPPRQSIALEERRDLVRQITEEVLRAVDSKAQAPPEVEADLSGEVKAGPPKRRRPHVAG
jgi:transcriptional regulator with XRE-family HTH domain